MMREATRSGASFFLATVLVFHCITSTDGQVTTSAVTNSRTTLLAGYGPTSTVLTTLDRGELFHITCRVQDAYVFDDPWWLSVIVDGIGEGWVADYYANCGYIGYCVVPLCL